MTSASGASPSARPGAEARGHIRPEALGVDAVVDRDPLRLRVPEGFVLLRRHRRVVDDAARVKAERAAGQDHAARQRPVVAEPLQGLPDAPEHGRAAVAQHRRQRGGDVAVIHPPLHEVRLGARQRRAERPQQRGGPERSRALELDDLHAKLAQHRGIHAARQEGHDRMLDRRARMLANEAHQHGLGAADAQIRDDVDHSHAIEVSLARHRRRGVLGMRPPANG